MRMRIVFAVICLAGLLAVSATQAAIIRVKPAGDDGNNGSSWQLAKKTVTAALSAAVSGDQIWVAAGKYTPANVNGVPASTFSLKNGVSILGGFAGDEADALLRNPTK